MAFKPVEKTSSGSTPFFDEYKKDLSNSFISFLENRMMEPKQIKAVQSGKGFILNFDDTFSVFIWKNSSFGKIIKEAIRLETCSQIILQFTLAAKGLGYMLGVDDEIECCLEEDKYDEGLYYPMLTTGTHPPIAPDENRKYFMDLPLPFSPPPTSPPKKSGAIKGS